MPSTPHVPGRGGQVSLCHGALARAVTVTAETSVPQADGWEQVGIFSRSASWPRTVRSPCTTAGEAGLSPAWKEKSQLERGLPGFRSHSHQRRRLSLRGSPDPRSAPSTACVPSLAPQPRNAGSLLWSSRLQPPPSFPRSLPHAVHTCVKARTRRHTPLAPVTLDTAGLSLGQRPCPDPWLCLRD